MKTKYIYNEITEKPRRSGRGMLTGFFFVLMALVLLGAFGMGVSGLTGITVYAATSGDWMYEEKLGNICIMGYKGSSAEITIPSTLDGKNVRYISDRFDDNCNDVGCNNSGKRITKITISSGITIHNTAFRELSKLNEVQFGNTIGNLIGENVFPSSLKK